jgi:hypothetical protein
MEESFETPPSTGKVALKWGLILGVVLIIFSLIINMTGNFGNNAIQSISYIFIIIGIVLAHRDYKQTGDGYMSYGKGLGIGTLTVIIAFALSGIFGYIYMTSVDPTLIDQVKEQQMIQYEEQGMSDAQIEQAMSFTERFMTPGMLSLFGLLFSAFIGFILSLIISAFTKNSNPELDM